MIFEIRRTSGPCHFREDVKPCEGAYIQEYIGHKYTHVYDKETGKFIREEKDDVQLKRWVIQVDDLSDLCKLFDTEKQELIVAFPKGMLPYIEIYDDYRE